MIIKGKVIKGSQKAREMGFPTANIEIKENIDSGIYAGFVFIDGENFDSAIYIGKNKPSLIEAHIFDFNSDLYDKELEISILDKIRDDIDESDPIRLKEMIQNDIEMVRIELNKNLGCLPV